MNNLEIIIPKLPELIRSSPRVVLVLNEIRKELNLNSDEYHEFYLFTREFPSFFRYHINHIEYRLESIHKLYEHHKNEFLNHLHSKRNKQPVDIMTTSTLSNRVYWDFEALLCAASSSLDILARISGVAYNEQIPFSLTKFSKKKGLTGIVDLFSKAQEEWINNMKEYRDCFVHFTPVDYLVSVRIYRQKRNWKMWCKIPINPNSRVAEGFIFSKKLDLLHYSISVYQNLIKLDKLFAIKIQELYTSGQFPKRTKNLFYFGRRER